MAASTTQIVNNTKQALNMKVGNHHYFVDVTSVPKGAKHTIHVDFNGTYQEYFMGVDRKGEKLIVSSDDCCDYKCITINEVDGKFDVQKVPRNRFRSTNVLAKVVKKPKLFSWRMCRF